MKFPKQQSKSQDLPSARKIRRSCQNELYRTIKRLNMYIPPDKVKEAEHLYTQKVLVNLIFIVEHGSNRKKLADWWDQEVCRDIAACWNVNEAVLSKAFRDAFGA